MIDAPAWIARGAALATCIAAVELLLVARAITERGVFRWSILRRDFASAPAPVRALADLLFSTGGTLALLVVQLASGILLALDAHAIWPWIAFATTLAIAFRFRRSYNGGSDSMLLVVLLGLALVRTSPALARAGLGYIAVQLVLSYVLAGVAKLRAPEWRRGRALPLLVALPSYGVPARLQHLTTTLGGVGTYAVLAFELGFPLALLAPTACLVLLSIAAAFHLANAFVFGLNRFLWSWLAAYPALIYWVVELRGR